MRILTRDEIRAVENRAFDGLFTEAQLMERAGLACADKMLALYGDQMKGQPVAVVCGNGKNAGDGFVIARRLRARSSVPQCASHPQRTSWPVNKEAQSPCRCRPRRS